MAENLILTGFMGSGKTAVGKRLAERLGREFIDTDPLIEERAGMSIPEIFEARGEPGFRKVEEEVVMGVLTQPAESADSGGARTGAVVSLGGGAVTTPAVYEKLMREPLVVFLDEDIDAAFERARGGQRPLAAERENFISLFSEREILYRSVAKFIIDTRGRGVDEVAGETIKLIHERTGII